ncbi:hypothetical protein H257_07757 [Aphanomyces astaci]|uniref:Uncharacterized protein n=1 Tax=Aphanomyces astaci TaxID=112090 RepID=W4GJ69_APHAT|nr:hypothetical protein H257_07757 [Aphanomyces astaci]ETV78973.1 hypothetical protein H257_07757 [Aphanomyces astaci]|eukprot:XP_009831692.1 hypothetical protein H257_07757 [Aphanomyces astaci]
MDVHTHSLPDPPDSTPHHAELQRHIQHGSSRQFAARLHSNEQSLQYGVPFDLQRGRTLTRPEKLVVAVLRSNYGADDASNEDAGFAERALKRAPMPD